MKGKEELKWGIILGIFSLLGYFFTWANFDYYQEKVQEIEQQNSIKILKQKRKKELEVEKKLLEKKRELSNPRREQEIFPFQHVLEFETLLMRNLQKNHLKLLSISRIIFDENFVKIPVEFEGSWQSVFPFLTSMEENSKTVFLSQEYLKIQAGERYFVKVQCTFMIQVEEKEMLEADFFMFEQESKKKSYIKVGDRYVHF